MQAAIVADGGPGVGLGHMGRCMALAQAIKKTTGVSPVFITPEVSCARWIRKQNYPVRPSLKGKAWDLIVADSYRFKSKDWINFKTSGKRLLAWDDVGWVHQSCDWLLNTSAGARGIRYRVKPSRGFFLGTRFHPLRNEFLRQRPRKTVSSFVKKVLVIMGGGPGSVWGRQVCDEVRKRIPTAEINFVTGPLGSTTVKSGPGLKVHHSPSNLPVLMKNSDLAVSAGGQTLYELAYFGVPIIGVMIADNQESNIQGLSAKGALIPAGMAQDKTFRHRLGLALDTVANNARLRASLSKNARACVDGKGGARVAKALEASL